MSATSETLSPDTVAESGLETVTTDIVPEVESPKEAKDIKSGRTKEHTEKSEKEAVPVPVSDTVTGDLESSSDSLGSDTHNMPANKDEVATTDEVLAAASNAEVVSDFASKEAAAINQSVAKEKLEKEAAKEEKKKSKKKEDKSVEYMLRALNSLQSPEEKLAALCKKYADLHEEHRVLQNSFKTQQRTLSVAVREKDQLQSEHTKAMIGKSKLESLCRELQKHNKLIKDESLKRAKEDDEKRKEISAQFSVTIGEIQSQMNDNSEKNNKLRKENDSLAEQLHTFITQCQCREEHVKKLQEHHEIEKKLAAAKLTHAETILKELEEYSNKEKEVILLKLEQITNKAQTTESQLRMYKSKYDEFSDLHTRSSEMFQQYKTEMDKMTKRIKKLEKDGLQWKTKWEATSKTLLEQYEARSKLEKETTVSVQKIKRLESLCRALQAELHGKKAGEKEEDENVKDNNLTQLDATAKSEEITPSSQSSSSNPENTSSPELAVQSPNEHTVLPTSTTLDSPPQGLPDTGTAALNEVGEDVVPGQLYQNKDRPVDTREADFSVDNLVESDQNSVVVLPPTELSEAENEEKKKNAQVSHLEAVV